MDSLHAGCGVPRGSPDTFLAPKPTRVPMHPVPPLAPHLLLPLLPPLILLPRRHPVPPRLKAMIDVLSISSSEVAHEAHRPKRVIRVPTSSAWSRLEFTLEGSFKTQASQGSAIVTSNNSSTGSFKKGKQAGPGVILNQAGLSPKHSPKLGPTPVLAQDDRSPERRSVVSTSGRSEATATAAAAVMVRFRSKGRRRRHKRRRKEHRRRLRER